MQSKIFSATAWIAGGVLLVGGGLVIGQPAASDVSISVVFLAQTHVMQPDQPYFKLTGNRDALLKVQVVSRSAEAAPPVVATVVSGGETNQFALVGPATLPGSFNSQPGQVKHSFGDSFTTMIPARLVRSGMKILVSVASQKWEHEIKVGAPTMIHMKMFDVHYFGRGAANYPTNMFRELESKWPVAGFEVERIAGLNFPEMVIPARAGLPAVRITSTDEYKTKTGQKFDGKQAAALQWVHALSRAGGNEDVAMCYVNILGVFSGGQAGNFNGVGGPNLGILNHELGHAFGLLHNSDNPEYPYHGEMFGIKPPKNYKEIHAGPTWAFDLPSKTFIPPTVQTNRGKSVAGTYKCDPMEGGGVGDQEPQFLFRHFSDYNVHKMQAYLENHVAVRRGENYFKWDDAAGDYARKVESNGVNYPIAQDVPVISVMAAMTISNLDVNMVYPPIGPYRGNLIRTFDPRNEADRAAAQKFFSPKSGCDFTLKIMQGGKENFYLLAASATDDRSPNMLRDLATEAVNLRADEGRVTAVELLATPKADRNGLPENPRVLARWPKG
jgi:Peptidase M66